MIRPRLPVSDARGTPRGRWGCCHAGGVISLLVPRSALCDPEEFKAPPLSSTACLRDTALLDQLGLSVSVKALGAPLDYHEVSSLPRRGHAYLAEYGRALLLAVREVPQVAPESDRLHACSPSIKVSWLQLRPRPGRLAGRNVPELAASQRASVPLGEVVAAMAGAERLFAAERTGTADGGAPLHGPGSPPARRCHHTTASCLCPFRGVLLRQPVPVR